MKARLIKRFEDEISQLDRELTQELPKEIQRARELGDLRENAEYAAAKERQRFVEARISMLRQRVSQIQLINLEIWNNPALEQLSFSALEYLGRGFVAGNASLVEVSLPRLNSVGILSIHDNQQLDGVALSQSFADIPNNLLRVAPDQTQSQLDPCPWTTDDVCDEGGLCAPGTDPVCSQF